MAHILPLLLILISLVFSMSHMQREEYRLKIKEMFFHGYDSYINNAFPMDELKPMSCTGINNFGGISLTLIDTLDSLVVFGNYTEFEKQVWWISDNVRFDHDVNISVFETNIRVLGGLLSSHLIITESRLPVLSGKRVYKNELLNLAADLGRRLTVAFNTPTGIPYGTVNLKYGVPRNETPITCTACAGTYVLEFGILTALTNDSSFFQIALRAVQGLWDARSAHSLFGHHIDCQTGAWVGIGARGIDSFYEYMIKGYIFFNLAPLGNLFASMYDAIRTRLVNNFYIEVDLHKPTTVYAARFESLQGYWVAIQVLCGHLDEAVATMFEFHGLWRRFGFAPESYDFVKDRIDGAGYPLRPEMAESLYYLSLAVPDSSWFDFAKDMVDNIDLITKVPCGYAAVDDVRIHSLRDTMDSFFLSETLKYLYLLFDSDNHFRGQRFIWNTEGHPFPISKKFQKIVLQNEIRDNLGSEQCKPYPFKGSFNVRHRLTTEHCEKDEMWKTSFCQHQMRFYNDWANYWEEEQKADEKNVPEDKVLRDLEEQFKVSDILEKIDKESKI